MDNSVIYDLYKRGMSITKITDELYKHKNRYFRDKYYTGEGIDYKKYTKDECRQIVCKAIIDRL